MKLAFADPVWREFDPASMEVNPSEHFDTPTRFPGMDTDQANARTEKL